MIAYTASMLLSLARVIVSLLFVAAATSLAFFSVPAAIIAICSVILVVLHPRLASVIEFSFGPLKATLERNISQSELLIAELKDMAVAQARVAAAAAAHTGRFAQANDWIFVATKDLESRLVKMGVPDEEIVAVRKDLVRFTLVDLGARAIGANSNMSWPSDPMAAAERRQILDDDRTDADAIEAYLTKYELLTPARAQLIEDIRWIKANQDVRDRAQYLRAWAEPA
jgi:hypothetical protein